MFLSGKFCVRNDFSYSICFWEPESESQVYKQNFVISLNWITFISSQNPIFSPNVPTLIKSDHTFSNVLKPMKCVISSFQYYFIIPENLSWWTLHPIYQADLYLPDIFGDANNCWLPHRQAHNGFICGGCRPAYWWHSVVMYVFSSLLTRYDTLLLKSCSSNMSWIGNNGLCWRLMVV